jgi:hypothetical protein
MIMAGMHYLALRSAVIAFGVTVGVLAGVLWFVCLLVYLKVWRQG